MECFARQGWRACAASVLALSSACAASISGEVDGEAVPGFTSSALGVVEQPGTDAVGLIAYFMTGGDACNVLARAFEIQQDESDPEEEAEQLEELFKESTPEDFWYATVSVLAEDADDLEDEVEVDLEDFDEDIRATFNVCHRDEYPQEKNGFLDVDDDCYVAEDGVLTLAYSEEDALQVGTDKEMDLNDDDGDDAGEITFSGRALYCKALSDALEDGVSDGPGPPEPSGECTFSSDCQLDQIGVGSCEVSDDCPGQARCVLDSQESGVCVEIVEDSIVCSDRGLSSSFFSSVEGESVPTCVSFDVFCDGGSCSF